MNHWDKIAAVKKMTPQQRFDFYVEKSEGCWLWIGCLMRPSPANPRSFPYGTIFISGKKQLAHRFSWELHFGTIPDGMSVLHTCDNPRCVNPLHLSLGSQSENINDRDDKGRSAMGESHGFAKLTEDAVRLIRVSKPKDDKAWAEKLGVNKSTVRHARTRRTWKHVGDLA